MSLSEINKNMVLSTKVQSWTISFRQNVAVPIQTMFTRTRASYEREPQPPRRLLIRISPTIMNTQFQSWIQSWSLWYIHDWYNIQCERLPKYLATWCDNFFFIPLAFCIFLCWGAGPGEARPTFLWKFLSSTTTQMSEHVLEIILINLRRGCSITRLL